MKKIRGRKSMASGPEQWGFRLPEDVLGWDDPGVLKGQLLCSTAVHKFKPFTKLKMIEKPRGQKSLTFLFILHQISCNLDK